MPRFAQVILDRSTGKTLDYEIPQQWREQIEEGSRVRVPLRDRQVLATVVTTSDTTSAKGVRPIAAVLDERPQMTPVLMRLAKWMADYYACGEQEALRSVLPRAVRETGTVPETAIASWVGANGCWNASGTCIAQLKKNESFCATRCSRTLWMPAAMCRATVAGSATTIS